MCGMRGAYARPGLAGWFMHRLSPCKAGPCGGGLGCFRNILCTYLVDISFIYVTIAID